MPGPPGQLIVLGGLTSASTSASGIYAVRTATGTAQRIGALSTPLYDAAGAVSRGRALVFGGGSRGHRRHDPGILRRWHRPRDGIAADAALRRPGGHHRRHRIPRGRLPREQARRLGAGHCGRPDLHHGRNAAGSGALPGRRRPGRPIYLFSGQAITGPHAGAAGASPAGAHAAAQAPRPRGSAPPAVRAARGGGLCCRTDQRRRTRRPDRSRRTRMINPHPRPRQPCEFRFARRAGDPAHEGLLSAGHVACSYCWRPGSLRRPMCGCCPVREDVPPSPGRTCRGRGRDVRPWRGLLHAGNMGLPGWPGAGRRARRRWRR